MTTQHYGTVIHWFDDMQRGSIALDDSNQRLFFDGSSLSSAYHTPHAGDRVSFHIRQNGAKSTALDVALAEFFKNHQRIKITLTEWDLMQNGGFGKSRLDPHSTIFVLGQFLTDQTTAPEIGDILEGRLVRQTNGQWLLTDCSIVRPQEPIEPVAEPEPQQEMPSEKQTLRPSVRPKSDGIHIPLPPEQILSGTIANWNDEKGYGFICYGDESQNIFFHISSFYYTGRRPKNGQAVRFYCNRPAAGERQQAVKVVLAQDERFLSAASTPDSGHIRTDYPAMLTGSLGGSLFLFATALASVKLALFYALLSLTAFFLYRQDKQIAQTADRQTAAYIGRIPEKTLHWLGLAGGWPGAWLARTAFRHKTAKTRFVVIFWLTVVINIAITYALLIHYADNPISQLLKN